MKYPFAETNSTIYNGKIIVEEFDVTGVALIVDISRSRLDGILVIMQRGREESSLV